MIRHFLLPVTFVLLLSGCNRAAEDKTAVKTGILEHLAKNSGLDLKSMDVEITTLRFEGGEALATVAFRPKDNPDAGMTMNYTMERKGSQWAVKDKAGSKGVDAGGGGHVGGGGMQVQPGEGIQPERPTEPEKPGELPAGHPPISSPESSKK